jgi:hypothetical protein
LCNFIQIFWCEPTKFFMIDCDSHLLITIPHFCQNVDLETYAYELKQFIQIIANLRLTKSRLSLQVCTPPFCSFPHQISDCYVLIAPLVCDKAISSFLILCFRFLLDYTHIVAYVL